MTRYFFNKRIPSLVCPVTDMIPGPLSDSIYRSIFATSLNVQSGGTIGMFTVASRTQTLGLADYFYLPVGDSCVRANGMTATDIHALVKA